jgi:uncharacterized protein (DUF2236 family)
MLSLTFGDETEAGRVAAGINAVHDRVRGTLPEGCGPLPAGTPYSAHDPGLLLWVHVTLLDSIPLAYHQLVGPLSSDEVDAYCEEAALGVARLGLEGSEVPRAAADVQRYLASRYASGTILASRQAVQLAREVLAPPLGWLAGPAAILHRDLSVGTLSPFLRSSYGFGWTDRDERRLRRTTALVRRVRAVLPDPVARFRIARLRRLEH